MQAAAKHRVNVINPFRNPSGSEWEAYTLTELLAARTAALCWRTSSKAHRFWKAEGRTRPLWPTNLPQLRNANSVYVGVYWCPKSWLRLAPPRRQIVVVNTYDWIDFNQMMNRLRRIGPEPELVYVCKFQREVYGLPGEIHPSPIDLDKFAPAARMERRQAVVIGRHSRDEFSKHHLLFDAPLYRHFATRGCKLRLMGGTCLAPQLQGADSIELLPVMTETVPQFLQSLDIFFYRTGAWLEGFPRVIFEAMAAGLPVVSHVYGGQKDYIDSGVDGFLFETQSEAMDMVETLRKDPDLRARIGAAARRKVESLFGEGELSTRVEFYFR